MSEGILFLIYIIIGLIIGILFDFFRVLRRSFKTSDFITCLQDITFWLISGIILIYAIFVFNNGELRGYIFLGLIIGIVFYIITISKFFIKINVFILEIIKKIFGIIWKIIIYPINFLRKILIMPLNIIKNCLSKLKIMIKNKLFYKKNKKIEEK